MKQLFLFAILIQSFNLYCSERRQPDIQFVNLDDARYPNNQPRYDPRHHVPISDPNTYPQPYPTNQSPSEYRFPIPVQVTNHPQPAMFFVHPSSTREPSEYNNGCGKDTGATTIQHLVNEIQKYRDEATQYKLELNMTQNALHNEKYGWIRWRHNAKWCISSIIVGFCVAITLVTHEPPPFRIRA